MNLLTDTSDEDEFDWGGTMKEPVTVKLVKAQAPVLLVFVFFSFLSFIQGVFVKPDLSLWWKGKKVLK